MTNDRYKNVMVSKVRTYGNFLNFNIAPVFMIFSLKIDTANILLPKQTHPVPSLHAHGGATAVISQKGTTPRLRREIFLKPSWSCPSLQEGLYPSFTFHTLSNNN
jgi:hypothetical protein